MAFMNTLHNYLSNPFKAELVVCSKCNDAIEPGNKYILAEIDGEKCPFCNSDCLTDYLLDSVDYEYSYVKTSQDYAEDYGDMMYDRMKDLRMMEEE